MRKHGIFTKPEVHCLSHSCKIRTKRQPQLTYIKFDEVRPCGFRDMQAQRQPDTLVTVFCTPFAGAVTITDIY